MKRKDIKATIGTVGAESFAIEGSMTLLNQKTGDTLEVDMPCTLAIIRGTLAWVDTLLEDDARPEQSTKKHMEKLLAYVGSSIAYDLTDHEQE